MNFLGLSAAFVAALFTPTIASQADAQEAAQSSAPAFTKTNAQARELDAIAALQAQMQTLERQMEQDRRQLDSLRDQLQALQSVALTQKSSSKASDGTTPSTTALQEAEAAASAQIATLDQEKVATESRFPLRLHGTVLLSAFVNSGGVDDPVEPTAALGGPGSTGLSVRQTSFGLNAFGPHLAGAQSSADLDVDFYGSAASGYANTGGLLRLRTAHAALAWKDAQAYLALDHTILAPYRPESLLAAASPELAWSGNLWAWNPQLGVAYHHGAQNGVGVEVALIDTADPYRPSVSSTSSATLVSPSLAEASRSPGVQSRINYQQGSGDQAAGFGVGGYYSPHRLQFSNGGPHYDFAAWAASLDFRTPARYGLQLTGTFYRGAALGGLGGGGYRDYVYRVLAGQVQVIALEDVGGWMGLHQRLGQHVTWNTGVGIDNPFANQLRAYPGALTGNPYTGVARNRTVFGDVIYAPRAYLLFSAEYRNLRTAPIAGTLWRSNIAGFGAAYRF